MFYTRTRLFFFTCLKDAAGAALKNAAYFLKWQFRAGAGAETKEEGAAKTEPEPKINISASQHRLKLY